MSSRSTTLKPHILIPHPKLLTLHSFREAVILGLKFGRMCRIDQVKVEWGYPKQKEAAYEKVTTLNNPRLQ